VVVEDAGSEDSGEVDVVGVEERRMRTYVHALRWGGFVQTTGVLHRPGDVEREKGIPGHCCLGVMCEIAIKGGLPLERKVAGGEDPRTWFSGPCDIPGCGGGCRGSETELPN
jgi:hypothetical protein